MGEYEPTEQELIDVLCRARETDWEDADYRANKAYAKMMDGTVRYNPDAPFEEYGSFLFRQKNYQPIPPDYMHDPAVWRGMSLSEILYNIFSQTGKKADKYRQVLRSTLDRYRLAALKKLSDVTCWEKDRFAFDTNEYKDADTRHQYFCTTKELTSVDIPETPLRGWYIEFCGDSKRDEWDCVYDEHLIKKILVVQELQKRIDAASLARPGVEVNQPQQTAAPAGVQVETADTIIHHFIEKFLTTATNDEKMFYVKGKGGRKKEGTPLIKDHRKELYSQFIQETKKNKTNCFAFSVFEGSWKRFKTGLKNK